MKQKKLLNLIGIFVLIIGLGAGITLVQESQLFRQKATTNSSCQFPAGCMVECPERYSQQTDKTCTQPGYLCCRPNVMCPSPFECQKSSCKDGYSPAGSSCNGSVCYCQDTYICCKKGLNCGSPGTLTKCGPDGGCEEGKRCMTGGGGGSPLCVKDPSCSGGEVKTCGPKSDPECNNKEFNYVCSGDGKKCIRTDVDEQNKPICKCQASGGGGGGTKTPKPTKKPGDDDGGGDEDCGEYNANGTAFTGFDRSAGLTVYIKSIYKLKIALKKNADSCSLSDNDVLLDSTKAADGVLDTGLSVASGDKVCIYLTGETGSPGLGWKEPEGSDCFGYDISDLLAKVPQAVSVQCWTDMDDCDFNDLALAFGLGEGGVSGDGIKLRFQGITKKANNQLIKANFFSGSSSIWNAQEVNVSNDDNGVYTLNVDSSVAAGTYDLLVKGHSHLQKRFTNLVYNGNNQLVDLSTTEANQCRAGDVTDDNVITIDDVAAVSKYYTDFAVTVNSSDAKMIAADINKDGKITIQDLALIAINWSDFEVEGDK